jgi:hypothetical protein
MRSCLAADTARKQIAAGKRIDAFPATGAHRGLAKPVGLESALEIFPAIERLARN